MTSRTEAWAASGDFVDWQGHRIFRRVRDGDGPPLVFLHGYPSSGYDWRLVLDRLPARRVVLFDFLGFGLSDKPRSHVYSLLGQADLVESLLPDPPALLVAHDMGTSVANELMARGHDFAGVLLLNGSMVLEKASLTISQKVLRSRLGPLAARVTNRVAFRAQFGRVFTAEHPLSADEAADQWDLLAHHGGHRIIDRLTYYLHERVTYADRWHGAIRDWPGRVELAWAGRDPVCTEAVLQAVRDLRPSAKLTRLPNLGHYPQLDDPAAVAAIVEAFAAG